MANAPDSEPTVAARKPLWRRLLRWAAWGVLGLLVLLLLFIGFLHTGPGQDFLRGQVESALNDRLDGGEAELGELEFALFGDIALRDLTIRDRDGRDAIALDELGISLGWGSLLSDTIVIETIALQGLDLTIEEDADGRSNLQGLFVSEEREPLEKTIDIQSLELADIDVALRRADGTTVQIQDFGLSAAIEAAPADERLDVTVDELGLSVEVATATGLHVVAPEIRMALALQKDGADVDASLTGLEADADVTLPDTEGSRSVEVGISSIVATIEDGRADIEVEDVVVAAISIGSLRASATVPAGESPKIEGQTDVHLESLHVDASALNALLGKRLLATDVDVDVHVAGPPDTIVLEGRVRTQGGALDLTGTVDASDLARPAYDLRLEGRDIATERLVAVDAPSVATSLDLTVVGEGTSPETAVFDVDLHVGETTFERVPIQGIDLKAHVERGVFTLKELVIRALGEELRIDGKLGKDRAFDASIAIASDVGEAVESAREAGLVSPEFELPVEAGKADVNLDLSGAPRAKGRPAAGAESELVPPEMLEKMPLGRAGVSGSVEVEDVEGDGLSAGKVRTDLDLEVDERGPIGTIALTVQALDAGAVKLDELDATIELRKESVHIELEGERGGTRTVDLLAEARLDKASNEIVLDLERASIDRGRLQTRLLEPVTLRLPREIGQDPVTIEVPRIAFAIAGGRVAIQGHATVHRKPPPQGATSETAPEDGSAPKGALVVDDMDFDVSLAGIDIRRAARMAGKRLPTGGRLDGRISVSGTPERPDADFNLGVSGIRLRDRSASDDSEKKRVAERSIDVSIDGGLHSGRATVDVAVHGDGPQREPLLSVGISAPLRTRGGVRLASGGRLALDVDVPRRTLGELLDYVPASMVPDGIDPNGEVFVDVALGGSPSRPDGRFAIELEGELLAFVDPAKWAGRVQRLALGGTLATEERQPELDVDLDFWLDTAEDKTLAANVTATLERSPLTARRLRPEGWTLDLQLPPFDLQRIPPSDPASPLPDGQVAAEIHLTGTERNLFGTIGLEALGVRVGELPAIDAGIELGVGERTEIGGTVDLGGKQRLGIEGFLELGGEGLLARLQKIDRLRSELRDTPFDLRVFVPRHRVAEWKEIASPVAELPGELEAELHLFETPGAPKLAGHVTYDEFEALDGNPGTVRIALHADDATAGAHLLLGGATQAASLVWLGATVPRDELDAFVGNWGGGIEVRLEGDSKPEATLRKLAPAFAIDGDALDIDGKIAVDLAGRIELVRAMGALGTREVDFDAALALTDAAMSVPGTTRRFEDINVVIGASESKIDIERIEAHERDMQTDERAVIAHGEVLLEELAPVAATLTLDIDRWLVTGTLDSPAAALTLDATVDADLSQPGKVVDVVIDDMFFDATTRYPRGHYFQDIGEHDIIWRDRPGAPEVGKLAPGHGAEPLVEPVPDPVEEEVSEPAELAAAEALEEPPPTHVVTVKIPEPVVAIRDVLQLEPKGELVIEIGAPGGLDIDGRIDIVGGSLEFVGAEFGLTEGSVTFDKPDALAWLDLNFARQPDPESQRAIVGDLPETRVRVLGDPAGNDLIIRGAGGPVLQTAMSTHIGQTPLRLSDADMPASETVATPEGEMPLIQSYMGTNLPHMLFLDHSVAWADPYEEVEDGDLVDYGEVRHAEFDIMLHDGDGRLRVQAEPPKPAGSEAEVHYDWVWGNSNHAIYGMGARLGDRVAAGLELFVEWSGGD